jgi:hypothetical protein
MECRQINRTVTIEFNESEYETLNFLSINLNLSIPEVVRWMVPKMPAVKVPETTTLQPQTESSLQEGSYKIRENYDKARLTEIVGQLFQEENKAITLAKEIKAQLIDENHLRETLNTTTEKRLLRWAHPARVDDRTRFVKPKAKEICMILFGFVPERGN